MKIYNLNTNPINKIDLKNTKQETDDFKKVLENAKESQDDKALQSACANFEQISGKRYP